MKEEIIKYFKTDRSFSGGVALYMKYGVNNAFKKTLNLQGQTRLNEGILSEQLKQLAGLTDVEYKTILQKPVEKVKVMAVPAEPIETKEVETDPDETDLTKKILPEMVKKTIRLREEFPFLKNPDCPNELKILVSDMLTTYDKYVESHEALFTAQNTEEALTAVAATVENYLENRQIWDELNHYKEKGEILGQHPIFFQLEVFAKLKEMSTKDLYKRKETLYNAIARVKKQLKDNEKPELTQQRQESLASKEAEYKEVLRLLNINE